MVLICNMCDDLTESFLDALEGDKIEKDILIDAIKVIKKIKTQGQKMEGRLRLYKKRFESYGRGLGFEVKRVKK